MTKEIIVDMAHVQNEAEVIYRFYKALDWFPFIYEYETKGEFVNLDAFKDNLASLEHFRQQGVTHVHVVLCKFLELLNTTSEEFGAAILEILANLGDGQERCDGIEFDFAVQLQ